MLRFRPTKISYRLTITYAMLFFIAIALVNVATLFSINYYINQAAKEQILTMDEAIIKDVKTFKDIPNIDLKNLSQLSENVDINLIYKTKSIYTTGENYSLPDATTGTIRTAIMSEAGENKIMYLLDVITLQDGEKIQVQVIKNMDNENDYLHALAGIMLSIDAIVFFFAIIVGYLISKKALSPIDKITTQAKQISGSDLSERIHIEGPDDELKRLSDTFNELISRIQLSYEKQKRFTLDASHELATPLAVIKGYTDILDRWGKDDRQILNESIESIKVEIKNITSLLDTLLFLSKGDNEIYKMEATTFWLNQLMAEIVKESNLVYDKHKTICAAYPEIQIEGDRSLIKQMLRAIADNSIKYSSEDSPVHISYFEQNKHVIIEIADCGIGIPADELPRIFDRFYRVDKARSRSIGGAGLGLSLVKWIADIHKATIYVESQVGEGTKFTISMKSKI